MTKKPASGYTLIEIMIALAIVGVLMSVALPAYSDYKLRALIAQAAGDISEINLKLQRYYAENRTMPADLSPIGAAAKLDPWGKPYQYLNLEGKGTMAKARKNKNLVPINSQFDLYSKGKDGDTIPPLTAKPSRDDIVLANDGRFIGLASTYE